MENETKVKPAEAKPKATGQNYNKYLQTIIHLTVKIIIVLLLLMLIYSVAEFSFLVIKGLINYNSAFTFSTVPVDRNNLFFTQVQGLISAALLLTILIEFIQSLQGYLKSENTNYVSLITEIALIAIVRHILTLDLEHIEPGILFGLSALIFVLGMFFMLMNRKHINFFNRKQR